MDGADTQHLKAIRKRCKQASCFEIVAVWHEVEADLAFLEQEILEKFRNQALRPLVELVAAGGLGEHG